MKPCVLCEGRKFKTIATEIREGDGIITQCVKCGLIMQVLDLDEKRLRDYYEEEYQVTNSLISGKKISAGKHFEERVKTIAPLFERVRPLLSPGMKVLEIGGGPGALLSLCKPLVKKCVGVELNTEFVKFMQRDLSIEAHAADINKLNLKDRFGLIIMINTLDHLPNPVETLTTMKNLLSAGGRIYLETPNRDEALNFYLPQPQLADFRKFFWHRAHLYYFTKDTIAALFNKCGLRIRTACRHEYTLKNYMNWYFTGRPQPGFVSAVSKNELFCGKSDFEKRMNKLFAGAEKEFKKIMSETFRGDTLCCIGWNAESPKAGRRRA